jgi:hypothetical protein
LCKTALKELELNLSEMFTIIRCIFSPGKIEVSYDAG